jgi:hypothetical protein
MDRPGVDGTPCAPTGSLLSQLRVFANSDSEMQKFESSRPSQPVRLSAY